MLRICLCKWLIKKMLPGLMGKGLGEAEKIREEAKPEYNFRKVSDLAWLGGDLLSISAEFVKLQSNWSRLLQSGPVSNGCVLLEEEIVRQVFYCFWQEPFVAPNSSPLKGVTDTCLKRKTHRSWRICIENLSEGTKSIWVEHCQCFLQLVNGKTRIKPKQCGSRPHALNQDTRLSETTSKYLGRK